MNLDRLLVASLQIAVAATIVWLICRLFPRIHSNCRSWLWRLVGLKCLFAFLFASAQFSVYVDRAAASPPATLMSANAAAAALLSEPLGSPQASTTQALNPGGEPLAPDRSVRDLIPWALSALWWIGFSLVSLRAVFALRRVRRVLATAGPDPVATELLHRVQRRANDHHFVRILVAPDLGAPAVVGLRTPTILIPKGATDNSDALESAIAHELAHIRRRDLAWVLAGEACRAVFWFHPLVWLACREHHAESEIAADRLARSWIARSPRDYGQHLLSWLDKPSVVTQSPGLMLSTHELGRRFKAMSLTPYRRPLSLAIGAFVAGPLVLGFVPIRLLPKSPSTQDTTIIPVPESSGAQVPLIPKVFDPIDAIQDQREAELVSGLMQSNNSSLKYLGDHRPEGHVMSFTSKAGEEIDLLGLTHIEAGNTRAWSADGTPLSKVLPVTVVTGIPARVIYSRDKAGKDVPVFTGLTFGRQALIRLSPNLQGVKGFFELPESQRSFAYPLSDTMPVPGNINGDRLLSICQGFPKESTEANLVIRYFQKPKFLGASKVKNGIVIDGPATPKSQFSRLQELPPTDSFYSRELKVKKNDLILAVAKPDDPVDSVRAKVFDRTGRAVSLFSVGNGLFKNGAASKTRSYWLVRGAKAADIAKIEFSVTRQEEVIFKGVQLHPHQ